MLQKTKFAAILAVTLAAGAGTVLAQAFPTKG